MVQISYIYYRSLLPYLIPSLLLFLASVYFDMYNYRCIYVPIYILSPGSPSSLYISL